RSWLSTGAWSTGTLLGFSYRTPGRHAPRHPLPRPTLHEPLFDLFERRATVFRRFSVSLIPLVGNAHGTTALHPARFSHPPRASALRGFQSRGKAPTTHFAALRLPRSPPPRFCPAWTKRDFPRSNHRRWRQTRPR